MSELTTTTVSIPQHLAEKLEVVVDLLPDELKDALSVPLKNQVELSYAILLKISQWARTEDARKQLAGKQLNANDYAMISLLSGTITSPLSKFPKYESPEDPAETAHKNLSDRRAIIGLVNALFSIGGTGFASWWASKHVGWRDEWRALFALSVALMLAATEGILFIIWQSREDKSRLPKGTRLQFDQKKKREKLLEDAEETEITPAPVKKEKDDDTKLRKRRADAIHYSHNN